MDVHPLNICFFTMDSMLAGAGVVGAFVLPRALFLVQLPAECQAVDGFFVRVPMDIMDPQLLQVIQSCETIWGCIKIKLAIFGGMNIHLPVIWGSLGYQGFDSYPFMKQICPRKNRL